MIPNLVWGDGYSRVKSYGYSSRYSLNLSSVWLVWDTVSDWLSLSLSVSSTILKPSRFGFTKGIFHPLLPSVLPSNVVLPSCTWDSSCSFSWHGTFDDFVLQTSSRFLTQYVYYGLHEVSFHFFTGMRHESVWDDGNKKPHFRRPVKQTFHPVRIHTTVLACTNR